MLTRLFLVLTTCINKKATTEIPYLKSVLKSFTSFIHKYKQTECLARQQTGKTTNWQSNTRRQNILAMCNTFLDVFRCSYLDFP